MDIKVAKKAMANVINPFLFSILGSVDVKVGSMMGWQLENMYLQINI